MRKSSIDPGLKPDREVASDIGDGLVEVCGSVDLRKMAAAMRGGCVGIT